MYQDNQIIEQLGVANLPAAEQYEILNEARRRIGEAISSGLTPQQLNEYEGIINANSDVIHSWLDQNAPDYKDAPAYQELEAAYENDPERNDPAKLFASIAWVYVNAPNSQEVVAKVLDEYKTELNAPS